MKLIVRRPSSKLADGLVTYIDRTPVDVDRAFEQWEAYVNTFHSAGWEIIEVPPADSCPDGVFVEDAAVMFRDLCVLTRPGAPERTDEVTSVGATIRALGIRTESLKVGKLDGGDVLKVGHCVYVGLSERTDQSGIDGLAGLIRPDGFEVAAVQVSKALHLKSTVTVLPDETVIGFDSLVDDPSKFRSYRSMPEPQGAQVVLIEGKRVMISSSAPSSAADLASLGFEPVIVEIDEFEKLEGCVTCLSIRVRN